MCKTLCKSGGRYHLRYMGGGRVVGCCLCQYLTRRVNPSLLGFQASEASAIVKIYEVY
jgi:hypothetical protein